MSAVQSRVSLYGGVREVRFSGGKARFPLLHNGTERLFLDAVPVGEPLPFCGGEITVQYGWRQVGDREIAECYVVTGSGGIEFVRRRGLSQDDQVGAQCTFCRYIDCQRNVRSGWHIRTDQTLFPLDTKPVVQLPVLRTRAERQSQLRTRQ